MLKSELIAKLASEYSHLRQEDLERVVNVILDEIGEALARGDRVELRGFGKELRARVNGGEDPEAR